MGIYSQIYTWPVWVRAFLWIGILSFIAWPLLMPLISKVLAFFFIVCQGIIRGIYEIIGGLILSPLHKKFGGKIAYLNNNFTSVLGWLDERLIALRQYFGSHTKRYMKFVTLISATIFALIILPDILAVEETASIRALQTVYLKTENKLFGEPVLVEPKHAELVYAEQNTAFEPTPEPTPTPRPTLTIINIKNNLKLRENAGSSAKSLATLSLGDTVYFLGDIVKNGKDEWVYVESMDGMSGWIRRQYLEGDVLN